MGQAMTSIEKFFKASHVAVAGASAHRHKYGNKVFRRLVEVGYQVYPLNPIAEEIEGHQAYPKVADLPEVPESMSIITPPEVTRQIVTEAVAAGVQNLWMQPGAEDEQASKIARDAGLNVIDDGSCILVLMAGM